MAWQAIPTGVCEEDVMASIEQSASRVAARHAYAQAAQRMSWGAQWLGSFLGETGHDGPSSLRPEDVARGEVFYRSTGCWV